MALFVSHLPLLSFGRHRVFFGVELAALSLLRLGRECMCVERVSLVLFLICVLSGARLLLSFCW